MERGHPRILPPLSPPSLFPFPFPSLSLSPPPSHSPHPLPLPHPLTSLPIPSPPTLPPSYLRMYTPPHPTQWESMWSRYTYTTVPWKYVNGNTQSCLLASKGGFLLDYATVFSSKNTPTHAVLVATDAINCLWEQSHRASQVTTPRAPSLIDPSVCLRNRDNNLTYIPYGGHSFQVIVTHVHTVVIALFGMKTMASTLCITTPKTIIHCIHSLSNSSLVLWTLNGGFVCRYFSIS